MLDWSVPTGAGDFSQLGVPGITSRMLVAAALLWWRGSDEVKLKGALASFGGVKRRFDFYINTPQRIYMDDYAHHPNELKAAITSFREMFPGRRLTVVFQPHLYTRTRDFCREFAEVLSLSDEVLLLPIYPAREEPIEGVCSEMLLPLITAPARVVPKMNCWHCWARKIPIRLLPLGRAISTVCEPIAELLGKRSPFRPSGLQGCGRFPVFMGCCYRYGRQTFMSHRHKSIKL